MTDRPDFTDRKIHVLENPTVKYKEGEFETYAKALRQAIKRGEISYQAGWLWLTISELAGDDREAYAGQEYLANELNTSVPTLKRWTKELEATGWLVKQNRTATSNKYWIAIPAEADALHQDYTPRLTTVGQELSTRKRSTRAKSTPAEAHSEADFTMAEDDGTHKLTDELMANEPMSNVHKLMDEPMHKLTGEPIDKLTDEPLTRQSIKETEHNDTELASYQGVTYSVDQGQPLAETNATPGSSLGEVDKGVEISSGESLVEPSRVSDAPVSVPGDVVDAPASPTPGEPRRKQSGPRKKSSGTAHVPAPTRAATRPQGASYLANLRMQGQQHLEKTRLAEEETARRKAEFAAYTSAQTTEEVGA